MIALPAASAFTGSGVTEGEFKTQLTAMRAFLSGLLGADGTQATALTTLGALMNGSVAKSAGYTVVAADRGKLIDCSGTWTLAVDAVATLGAGFNFAVRNGGTGAITIDPNLSETINGASTLVLDAGESCAVLTNADASGWLAVFVGGGGDGQFRGLQVITASGTYSKPTGLKRVRVTVIGGGGGGGGCPATTCAAGGGGAGGGCIKVIPASALGATESVTVGGGGAGGNNLTSTGQGDGSAGGTSSFGSHCSASGGGGGARANTPGGGGSGFSGDINFAGYAGDFGLVMEVGGVTTTRAGKGGQVLLGTLSGGGNGRNSIGFGDTGGQGYVFVEEFF